MAALLSFLLFLLPGVAAALFPFSFSLALNRSIMDGFDDGIRHSVGSSYKYFNDDQLFTNKTVDQMS